MATYLELYGLRNNSNLRNRITIAIAIKGQTLVDSQASVKQVEWVGQAMADPASKVELVLNYMLAKQAGIEISNVDKISDEDLQAHVDAVIDKIIEGGKV